MGFLDTLLWPIMVAVAWIMVRAHDVLTYFGMDPAGGWTWLLSIVALTVMIRILLIPLFVRQIRASRGMQLVQPEIQKLQKKYKGKTDPVSRQAMQREMMAIHREAGTSPFASCLPILAQAPVFFALFRVLYSLAPLAAGNYQDGTRVSIGPLTQELAVQAEASEIFGASLSATFMNTSDVSVRVVSVVLILLMSATMFFTQRQLTMKNMPQSALDNPMARQQKMLMYLFPLIFMFTGVNFPIGVLIYWTTTNLWTMGQQFIVIRNSPTPGSEAEKKYLERKARRVERKGSRKKTSTLEDEGYQGNNELEIAESEEEKLAREARQRQQPKKNVPRAKRKGGGSTGRAPESTDGK